MQAPTPFRRNGGWGRRWEPREGGGSSRPQKGFHEVRGGQFKHGVAGDGGRPPETGLMEVGGSQRNLSLVSNDKGKQSSTDLR